MVSARLKSLFLDRPAIKAGTGAIERRAMTKVGAYVRTVARRSIRPATKNKRHSEPGEPVREQTKTKGKRYKDGIVFHYQPDKHDVVVVNEGRAHGLPALHEIGGMATVTPRKPVIIKGGTKLYIGDKLPPIRVRIEPRPVLQLALTKSKPKIMEFWKAKA